MKMMQGAFFFACSNMSRTRLAPTPTNISTKSEPEIVKNGTLASPAMARASKRLAGARRTDEQRALGNLAAEPLEFVRVFEEFDDLLKIFLGFIDTRHVLEGHAAMASRSEASPSTCQSPWPCRRPIASGG